MYQFPNELSRYTGVRANLSVALAGHHDNILASPAQAGQVNSSRSVEGLIFPPSDALNHAMAPISACIMV